MDTPEYYRFHASAEARGRWEEAWRRASGLEKHARNLRMSVPYAWVNYGHAEQARMRLAAQRAEVEALCASQVAERLRLEYLEVRDR